MQKRYFIHKNYITSLSESDMFAINVKLSRNFEERFTHYVFLNDEQIIFRYLNSSATVEEIWQMKLNNKNE